MSAMVADPVPKWAGRGVVCCILAPPRLPRGAIPPALEPAEKHRHASCGTSAAPRATHDAHVAEPRIADRGRPKACTAAPHEAHRPCFSELLGGRYLPCALVFHVREEEGLVDSSLEDRHAQLHALLDDLATLHAGFASELRGREMDCHQYESSW